MYSNWSCTCWLQRARASDLQTCALSSESGAKGCACNHHRTHAERERESQTSCFEADVQRPSNFCRVLGTLLPSSSNGRPTAVVKGGVPSRQKHTKIGWLLDAHRKARSLTVCWPAPASIPELWWLKAIKSWRTLVKVLGTSCFDWSSAPVEPFLENTKCITKEKYIYIGSYIFITILPHRRHFGSRLSTTTSPCCHL